MLRTVALPERPGYTNTCDPALDHGGRCLLDACGVTGDPDIGVTGPHEEIPLCNVAAKLGNKYHLTTGLPEEFTGRGETDSHTDDVGIHLDLLAHGLEFVVDLLDHRPCDDPAPRASFMVCLR